jgi:5-methylcytosine-specific restriction protein A
LVKAAKAKYGCICMICKFDFVKAYGDLGKDYIECHHLKPLADDDQERETKLEDVAVVCANCHRMIHRAGALRSIKEMKKTVAFMRHLAPGTTLS